MNTEAPFFCECGECEIVGNQAVTKNIDCYMTFAAWNSRRHLREYLASIGSDAEVID